MSSDVDYAVFIEGLSCVVGIDGPDTVARCRPESLVVSLIFSTPPLSSATKTLLQVKLLLSNVATLDTIGVLILARLDAEKELAAGLIVTRAVSSYSTIG
ncbi:hypothetical protein M8818_003472 [Zalaria obscura]|uniref:Uncharacterized protein n=1 Tax=Zalaria obscura TaxID=2024903 RepID=A0ACC3SET1_9PEZI